MAFLSTLKYAFVALVAIKLLYTLFCACVSPLRRVPGSFASRFTRLWYFNRVRHGNFQRENLDLHRKYASPVVRLGPNMFSIDDPAAVKVIYGIGSKFPKSDWYYAWQNPDPTQYTLFADQDSKRHAATRKRFQNLYSNTSLVSYEGFVDECADIFVQRLREMARRGKAVDMGHWFQCYAFDVIACITYGSRFGFLDRGEDIRGIIGELDGLLRYATLCGIFPKLHPWIFNISAKLGIAGARGRVVVTDFVSRRLAIRQEERKLRNPEKNSRKSGVAGSDDAPQDFLDRLLDQHDESPEKTTMYHVFLVGLANVFAGSDVSSLESPCPPICRIVCILP